MHGCLINEYSLAQRINLFANKGPKDCNAQCKFIGHFSSLHKDKSKVLFKVCKRKYMTRAFLTINMAIADQSLYSF